MLREINLNRNGEDLTAGFVVRMLETSDAKAIGNLLT
jgi:hypothetical protein